MVKVFGCGSRLGCCSWMKLGVAARECHDELFDAMDLLEWQIVLYPFRLFRVIAWRDARVVDGLHIPVELTTALAARCFRLLADGVEKSEKRLCTPRATRAKIVNEALREFFEGYLLGSIVLSDSCFSQLLTIICHDPHD